MHNKLKPLLVPLLAAATLTPAVSGSAVNETIVPADVEWLVHIDADTLRESRAGSALISELQNLSPMKDNPEIPVDPVLIINGLRGLSAFGSVPDFTSGEVPNDAVVVLEGTEDLMKVFRGLIAGVQLEQPDLLATLQLGDQTVYQMQGEAISGLFLNESQIAVGRSLDALESFLSVVSGDEEHLVVRDRFPSFKMAQSSGFFVGAVVEGVNGLENLPAQARILQLTRAVSLQLGEVGENLKFEAGLKTADPATATQVSQVLEGIIALTAITQTGLPDIAVLLDSAQVSMVDTTVSLELAYPVDAALGWIEQLAVIIAESMEEEETAEPEVIVETDVSVEVTVDDEASASSDSDDQAEEPGQ